MDDHNNTKYFRGGSKSLTKNVGGKYRMTEFSFENKATVGNRKIGKIFIEEKIKSQQNTNLCDCGSVLHSPGTSPPVRA